MCLLRMILNLLGKEPMYIFIMFIKYNYFEIHKKTSNKFLFYRLLSLSVLTGEDDKNQIFHDLVDIFQLKIFSFFFSLKTLRHEEVSIFVIHFIVLSYSRRKTETLRDILWIKSEPFLI